MLFQKEKIEVIAGRRGCLAAFPSEHLLLAVRGSCGRLSMDWFEPEKKPEDAKRTIALSCIWAKPRCSGYRPTAPLPVRVCWRQGMGYRRAAGKFVRSGLHWISHMPDLRMRGAGEAGPWPAPAGNYVLSYSDYYPPMVTGISSGMYRSH